MAVHKNGTTTEHPPHYNQHPSGIECIEITRHMGSNLGNVIKYVWRADLKGKSIEDLKKAMFYLKDEIAKREMQCGSSSPQQQLSAPSMGHQFSNGSKPQEEPATSQKKEQPRPPRSPLQR